MAEFLIRKEDVKQYKGHMTKLVQNIYKNNRNQIRLRSTYGEAGNISRIKIKRSGVAIYTTADTADAYKKLVDDNPLATLGELAELANETHKSELIEVANYFVEKKYKELVPVLELDTDKNR